MKKSILPTLRLSTYYIPVVTLIFFALAAFAFLSTLGEIVADANLPSAAVSMLYLGGASALCLTIALSALAIGQCYIRSSEIRRANPGPGDVLVDIVAVTLSSIVIVAFDRFMRGRIRFQADFRTPLDLTIDFDLEVVIIMLIGILVLLRQLFSIFKIYRRNKFADTNTEP